MKQKLFKFMDENGQPVVPTYENLEDALDRACEQITELNAILKYLDVGESDEIQHDRTTDS